jgi:hypothetical protein
MPGTSSVTVCTAAIPKVDRPAQTTIARLRKVLRMIFPLIVQKNGAATEALQGQQ